MADELISEYIDQSAIKAQTDFFIAELARLQAQFEVLKAQKDILTNSKGLPNASAAVTEADAATQNLIKTQKQLEEITKQLAEATRRLAEENKKIVEGAKQVTSESVAQKTAIKSQTTSLEENILARRRAQNSLSSLKAEEKENAALLKDGTINQKEYKARLADTTLQQEKLKVRISETSAEIKAQIKLNEAGRTAPNSIAEARSQNLVLGKARDKVDVSDNAKIAELNGLIDRNNALIDGNSDNLGKQKINIGNYSSALTGYANTLRGLRGPTKLLGEALGFSAYQADQFRLIIEHAAQALAAIFRGKEANAAAAAEAAAAEATDTTATAANTAVTATNTTVINSSTAATGINTIATEGAAVAQEGLTVATATTSGAMRIFKIALASTGIGLLLVAIGYIVYKIIEFRKAMAEANATTKLFAEVNEDAAKAAGKEIGSLKVLQAEIENTLIPMDKRLQAIKNLKDQYPELLKNTTDEALLQGKAATAYDLVAASILRKAQAQAAEAKIQELVSANLDIILKNDAKAEEANNKIRKAKDDQAISSGGSAGLGGNFGGVSKEAKQKAILENYNLEKAANEKLVELNNNKINSLLKLAAVEDNIQTDKAGKEKKEKKSPDVKESTKDLLDAEFEAYKKSQTEKIELLNEDVKNEKLSFEKRLAALSNYNDARLDLIAAQEKQEIKKEEEKQTALNGNLKNAKGTERNNIIAELKNIEVLKQNIRTQAAIDERKILRENEAENEALTKAAADRYLKIQKEKYDATIKLIEENANNEKAKSDNDFTAGLIGLEERLAAGKISEKKFNEEKLQLEFAYKLQSLEIEIDRAKQIIAIRAILGQDVSKELRALAKLEREIQIAALDHTKKIEKDKAQAMIDTFTTIKKVADEVFGIIDGLLNANLITQKNALKDQQNEAEKKAARDIEIVNASTLSEEQKAAKIIVINARLSAQKDQIAQKEKAAELEKARFDKAFAIFNIILNTAIAVIKALPNIPLSIAIGALGASQLAVAVATPIPKFFQGKGAGDNYEGPAIVGDGGKSEVIQRADGSIEFTPSTDTLTYVGKNDIIHPDKDAWLNAILGAAHRDANTRMKFAPAKQGNEVAYALNAQTQILKQIANKKEVIIGASNGGMVALHNWGARQTKYINENTNW